MQNVSRETRERLDIFAALFMKWAKAINLVAPSTKEDVWSRHIWDSAQIFNLAPQAATWVDLGSGGGFPGVITAIMMAELGDGWVHLVESNQKKASFLRVALSSTGARGSIHSIRAEDAPAVIPECDYVSARALADLDKLLGYASPWMIGRSSTAFFHKGRDYQKELSKAHSGWDFDLVKHQSSIQADSVILEIGNLRRRMP
ncbi:16S rRNA methyltransferase [Neorhizobium sp. NCHU2750]|nr:16S rRNA methyltransferase [Neorhizobium sp. NCHU2750]